MEFFQPFFGYYFFNALLLVLQALHVFWAYLIVRMVFKFVFKGKVSAVPSANGSCGFQEPTCNFPLKVERDERSDAESEDDKEGEGEEPEDEDEHSWKQQENRMNSKVTPLSNNSVLNNLTNQRSINSRLPKAR